MVTDIVDHSKYCCEHSHCCINQPCPINNFDNCKDKPKKLFRVIIDNSIKWVYDREKTVHDLGSMNGCCPTWWLLNDSKELEWIPWIDKGTNRPCWEINIKQGNSSKYKWGEVKISGVCTVIMKCNNQKVYSFNVRDIEYGLARASVLMSEMMEHPFNFMEPDSELNRRVWYKNQPAIVKRLLLNEGCIILEYCGPKPGFNTSNIYDNYHDHNINKLHYVKTVKVDLLDPLIWWFRDKGQGETNNYPNNLYEKIKYEIGYDSNIHSIFLSIDNKKITIPTSEYNEKLSQFHYDLINNKTH